MITKGVKFECKLDKAGRTFEGYASTFGNIDHDGDIILPGSFSKTIQEAFPANKIKVLWNHNWDKVIGKPLAMAEDTKGLHVKAQVSNTTQGNDILELMADGVIDRMSIGFWVPAGKSAQRPDGMREISEVALMEFSPVTFPANEQAAITGVSKSLRDMLHYAKGGLTDVARTELLHELDAIKALLTGQPPQRTAPDHSRQVDELKQLIKLSYNLT